ncbi:hypothetical protein FHT02_004181 [Sphingomonas xinjiangensis]|uniref:Glycoside hydrolase family 5 domain-containing protein n=2 Tax=Sphingomonas xinjiangensis TaxID=643568 RepID=A0A840YT81_9SPHN|nr:hypothetical protein [Sphingomonas xinjiangensis]
MSNSINGYIEDITRFVKPYIVNAGARAIRMPLRRKNLWNGVALTPVIKLNGYDTPQLEPIFKNIELSISNDVMFVIDDHTYSQYAEPDLLKFWVAFGTALQQRFGNNDLIVLELQNESGKGAWDPAYAQSVKALVAGIRAAGITYPLAIGWGNWNNVANFGQAMADLDKVGGPGTIDPLNRLIWTGHHYPTTTGNDQAKSGKSNPEISGSSVSPAIPTFFDGCKARRLQCMITEIGVGGGARGWLENGSGNPEFNGKAWFKQYDEIQSRYAGTVVGTIVWGGGSAWPDTYPFKVEYQKDGWAHTNLH